MTESSWLSQGNKRYDVKVISGLGCSFCLQKIILEWKQREVCVLNEPGAFWSVLRGCSVLWHHRGTSKSPELQKNSKNIHTCLRFDVKWDSVLQCITEKRPGWKKCIVSVKNVKNVRGNSKWNLSLSRLSDTLINALFIFLPVKVVSQGNNLKVISTGRLWGWGGPMRLRGKRCVKCVCLFVCVLEWNPLEQTQTKHFNSEFTCFSRPADSPPLSFHQGVPKRQQCWIRTDMCLTRCVLMSVCGCQYECRIGFRVLEHVWASWRWNLSKHPSLYLSHAHTHRDTQKWQNELL